MTAPIFSVILFIDKKEMLSSSLSFYSKVAQQEAIQLIVVDPSSNGIGTNFYDEFKGKELIYLLRPGMHVAEAYQEGLGYTKGKYVNFALASSCFSENAFSYVHEAFQTFEDVMISTNPYFVENDQKIPYDGAIHLSGDYAQIQLLSSREANHLQLLLQAYFFRREALEGIFFCKELENDALYNFILSLQLNFPKYLYLPNVYYYYSVPLEDTHAQDPQQFQFRWYADSVKNLILPLLKLSKVQYGKVPVFLQNACFYLIYVKIRCNLYNKDKGVLKTKKDVDDFFDAIFHALVYIDNNIIMQKKILNNVTTDRSMCIFLLRGKAKMLGKTLHIFNNNGCLLALFEPIEDKEVNNIHENICIIEKGSDELLKIQTLNYEKGQIFIDAYTELSEFLSPKEFKIYAVCVEQGAEKEIYQAEFTDVYPLIRCFGHTYMKKQAVHFILPVNKETKQTFRFFYTFDEKDYQFSLDFSSYNARVFSDAKDPYWKFRKGWMLRPNEGRTEIIIEKCNFVLQLKKEIRFCQSLSKTSKYKAISRRGILLRLFYWMLLPIFRKRHVWITFDKLYKGGDNGEYLFQYIRKNQKDVDIYYIIRKDSPDYQRLLKQHHGHVLIFGTLRCQLISLLAEVILATHAELSNRYNPNSKYRAFTKDLQRGEVICVQHGLTIQEIAQYQNRFMDNTKLYCCASPYEVGNLSNPIYGYSPDQLKITGLARYDGLNDRNQKIILITPTWRRNAAKTNVKDVRDRYNENFKDSDYFRIYNSLINDERLLKCAKRKGYRIVYLLHPVVSTQIDDFTHNGYVEFLSGEDVDYEDILCESSLMVTDYSGVQYDFAYMRKPVIYFHPAELPPHYEEGGMDYETMGFGPIFTNLEDTVTAICTAMEKDCKMEERYRKRANDFFAFNDRNNCERIFNVVKEYCENIDNF